MSIVLGIKLSPDSFARFYLPPEGEETPLTEGDFCLVEDPRDPTHPHMGFVSSREGRCACQLGKMPRVLRRAVSSEVERWEEERERDREILRIVRERVNELGLGMKIISLEPADQQMRVLFTAEGRVDFRTLVRLLARDLDTRIEFWQINPRQGAARLDGYGACGCRLCCSSWLKRCPTIGFRAAREAAENHSGPSMPPGACGRLRCCLRHEESDVQGCGGHHQAESDELSESLAGDPRA